ncbi:MAG: hypothetical protein J6N72_11185 [Psychrobacter sp.]|nr:hypothetical protein [Psychrobacter sp.]
MTQSNISTTEWNVQTVKQTYNLTDDHANLIIKEYKDNESFKTALHDFIRKYNATRNDGIATLVAWAAARHNKLA